MTDNKQHYNRNFYQGQSNGSYISAKAVIKELLTIVQPKSVVDVGCGVGTWLAAFKESSPEVTIQGFDGDYVNKEALWIAPEFFTAANLEQPLVTNKRYDLAMSLEVAEHLQNSSSATFVASLVSLSDVILFSAAIPWQGGTNHINEQRPEFWANLFAQHGYVCADIIRQRIWNDESIRWPYRQNALFFVKATELEKYPLLAAGAIKTDATFLYRVHERAFHERSQKAIFLSNNWSIIRYKLFRMKLSVQQLLGKKKK